ncbi:lipid A biosynthesis acyltransferase [Pseudovibrio sp. Tun.PSC04-5.I4]|uniref:lysophospholipid acyltransferase family protein n=1 Tax=Pseudovibrio sp. Tun.PSC04-5.I4 TaxID=1798213 RepID=UPI000882EDFB|nr:lipid A biosynthesis acyltransferase [Pseudovibrio sp. Tun.PSC04-5.I4]SDR03639.1 KDO2-lipid IV(A) lauroyltransferase [Pseudovibrio sp. Tun.PSC04-5.I4]
MNAKKTRRPITPRENLAYRLEWLALRAIGGILRSMPLDWASTFMGNAWRVFAPMTHRHARAKAHIMAAYPEMTLNEADKIIRDMWENLGRVSAETVLLSKIHKDTSRVIYPNPEVFAPSVGEGAVLVTMHSGNWEVVSDKAEDLGLPLAGVYQKLKNPYSEEYLVGKRDFLYKLGLYSKGHDTGTKIISILRKKGSVAFVADVRDVRGVKINFFNQQSAATHIPAALARTMNKRLIAVTARRTKGARFEIIAKEIPVARTKDRVQDAITTTQAVHDQFEEWIREEPSQWMWIMKKWI